MKITTIQYRNNSVPIVFDADERVIETVARWSLSLAEGAKKKSPGTVERYMRNIGYFIDWLKGHDIYRYLTADEALTSVTQGGVKEYLGELESAGLETNTIRNRDVTIKVFMDWLTTKEAGKARSTSTHDDDFLSNPGSSKVPEYLNEDQLIKFLLGFHNEYQRCAYHLMYDVGYRRSELVRALWKDFHGIDGWSEELAYAPIVVRGAKAKGGGIKERVSIISRPMLNRVFRYHSSIQYRKHASKWSESDRPAFLNVHGEPLTYGAIGDSFKLASKRTGMPVHSHKLRHGCAYNIMRSEHGKSLMDNLALVKKQLGHAYISSTEIYTQIPAILLSKMGSSEEGKTWYERSDKVFKNTYLPIKSHREKRGHSSKVGG